MLYSDLLEFGVKVQESTVLNLKILDSVASTFNCKILKVYRSRIPRYNSKVLTLYCSILLCDPLLLSHLCFLLSSCGGVPPQACAMH